MNCLKRAQSSAHVSPELISMLIPISVSLLLHTGHNTAIRKGTWFPFLEWDTVLLDKLPRFTYPRRLRNQNIMHCAAETRNLKTLDLSELPDTKAFWHSFMSFRIMWDPAQIQGDCHLFCVSSKRRQVKTSNPGDQETFQKREGVRNWSGDLVGVWQPWTVALLQAPGPWTGRSKMETVPRPRCLGRQQCVTRGRKAEVVGDGGLAVPTLQCVSQVHVLQT